MFILIRELPNDLLHFFRTNLSSTNFLVFQHLHKSLITGDNVYNGRIT